MQVFGLPDLGIRNARQVATLAAFGLNRHGGRARAIPFSSGSCR
jgi:hypothetical protein